MVSKFDEKSRVFIILKMRKELKVKKVLGLYVSLRPPPHHLSWSKRATAYFALQCSSAAERRGLVNGKACFFIQQTWCIITETCENDHCVSFTQARYFRFDVLIDYPLSESRRSCCRVGRVRPKTRFAGFHYLSRLERYCFLITCKHNVIWFETTWTIHSRVQNYTRINIKKNQ